MKLSLIIAIALAISWTNANTSDDWTTDPGVEVLSDKTQRNENKDEPGLTQGCHYIRLLNLKKRLEVDLSVPESHRKEYIYYHSLECMNMDLQEIRPAYITFSYDDQKLLDGESPVLQTLPPGCPPPVVARKPTICENGVKLGNHLVVDVQEILTKQMVDNPLKLQFDPNDPLLNSPEMQQVTVDLDAVEQKLEEYLQKYYDDVPNEPTPDSEERLPNDVVKQTYTYPDNSKLEVVSRPPSEEQTVNPDGSPVHPEPGTDDTPVEVTHQGLESVPLPETGVLSNPNNGEGPHSTVPGKTMLPEDLSELPPGTVHTTRVVEARNPENPSEVVGVSVVEVLVSSNPRRQVTKTWTRGPEDDSPLVFQEYVERLPAVRDASVISEYTWTPETPTSPSTSNTEVVDNPMRFDRPDLPSPVTVPEELYKDLGTVSQGYAEVLSEVVNQKARCLLDQIFHQKKYEIELVCAKTAAEADQNLLQNELIRELYCGGKEASCVEFLDDVKARMMAHVNTHGTSDGFAIEKKTYMGDIQAGAAN